MEIKKKQDFYKFQKKMLFNSVEYFKNLSDVKIGDNETITARNIIRPGSGTIYYKTKKQMMIEYQRSKYKNELNFMIDPPHKRIIQGEFTRTDGIYHLRYSLKNGPLGKAFLRNEKYATGLECISLIKKYMDEQSWEDLLLITDYFGDAYNVTTPVIEFSVFDQCVGFLKGRNTLIWEVRSY